MDNDFVKVGQRIGENMVAAVAEAGYYLVRIRTGEGMFYGTQPDWNTLRFVRA